MAWDGSNRRQRLPSDWQSRIVPRIKRKDHYQCQWPTDTGICGWPDIEVDHKIPGDDHTDNNLWCLCTWHHDKKSAQEGNQARRVRGYISEKRKPETHPGIVD